MGGCNTVATASASASASTTTKSQQASLRSGQDISGVVVIAGVAVVPESLPTAWGDRCTAIGVRGALHPHLTTTYPEESHPR